MIKGFCFVALTNKGRSEIVREIVNFPKNHKLKIGCPVKLKHVINIIQISDEPLKINVLFRKLFFKAFTLSQLTEDSSAIIEMKHELVKDLICLEGEDYLFKFVR